MQNRMTVKRSLRSFLPLLIFVFLFIAGFEDLAAAEWLEPAAETCMAPLVLAAGRTAAKKEKNADAPGIHLEEGGNVQWPCGIPFQEPGYHAVDSSGADLSAGVEIQGEVCCWKTGSYVLTYRVRDSEGREYEKLRMVEVVPVPLPDTVEKEKTIYLSFDDGPCQYTDRVLDILDAYGAKATFFIVGNSPEEYHDRIKKIYDKGHTIGIHCYDHDYGRLYSTEEYYFEDLVRARQLLYEYTGEYARICRFPGGSTTAFSFLGKHTEGGFDVIKGRLADMGMRYYDWNVKIEGEGRNGDDLFYTFIHQVPKYSTPVSLHHDTRLYSVNALERLLQWGQDKGYTFAAMDVSTPEIQSY